MSIAGVHLHVPIRHRLVDDVKTSGFNNNLLFVLLIKKGHTFIYTIFDDRFSIIHFHNPTIIYDLIEPHTLVNSTFDANQCKELLEIVNCVRVFVVKFSNRRALRSIL